MASLKRMRAHDPVSSAPSVWHKRKHLVRPSKRTLDTRDAPLPAAKRRCQHGPKELGRPVPCPAQWVLDLEAGRVYARYGRVNMLLAQLHDERRERRARVLMCH